MPSFELFLPFLLQSINFLIELGQKDKEVIAIAEGFQMKVGLIGP